MRPDASGTHARKVACFKPFKVAFAAGSDAKPPPSPQGERLERPVSRKSGDTGSRGEPLSSGLTAKGPSVQPPTGSQLAGALWRNCRKNARDVISLTAKGVKAAAFVPAAPGHIWAHRYCRLSG